MEPLKISRPLLPLLALAIVVPLLIFVFESLFWFDATALSSIFFLLLGRSVFFGLLQAVLSASLALLAAFVVATSLLSLRPKTRRHLETPLKHLGQIYFVIPGTAISLLILSLPNVIVEPLQGWTLVVAAHVLWSTLFVASHVYDRLKDWLSCEGFALLLAAKTMGAAPADRMKSVVFPLLRDEARTWFPLIFLWCFGAFSTVLLLGSGPQHSTPEVLLYYTLFNDVDSSRLLVVFVFTLALQLLLLNWSLKNETRSEEARWVVGAEKDLVENKNDRLELPASGALRSFSFLFMFFAAALVLMQIVFVVRAGLPDSRLWSSLVFSWAYALLSCLISFVFLLAVSATTPQSRKTILLGLAFSPLLLVTSWNHLSFLSALESKPLLSFLLSAFGLALLQIPFSALWIERSLSSMNPETELYARSAGLNASQIFWKLRLPYLRPSLEKILVFVFCAAIGEIALASMWLREWPLLSTLSKKLAQSYDFSGASWVFVLTVVSALGARFLISQLLRKFLR